MTEKYTNDKGQVAVVYSPGFGAGWSSENGIDPTHPVIAKMVHEGKQAEINDDLLKSLGLTGYARGVRDLTIEWMKPGTAFFIDGYEGSESIRYVDENPWVA